MVYVVYRDSHGLEHLVLGVAKTNDTKKDYVMCKALQTGIFHLQLVSTFEGLNEKKQKRFYQVGIYDQTTQRVTYIDVKSN